MNVLVAQVCPTLCDPTNYSISGSSVHGILQARILEWVTVPFSRGSSQPRDQTQISHIAGRFLTSWATREALNKSSLNFLMLCLVIQSCPTLCDPMDCSLPGSSVHGVLQARILEWVAMPSSRGSSQPKDWTQVSCIKGRFFIIWATRESSSHVWMWELAHKEGWVLKNWCFWTVEKTLESPLDCKEIKPVNPKGNQSWILTGGIDTESEAPIFWPPDVKSRLTGKDLNAGKDWRQEEKGTTEDEVVGWHHGLHGHEFEQIPGDSEGQGSMACYSLWGPKESDMTEWLNNNSKTLLIHFLIHCSLFKSFTRILVS